MTTKFDDIHKHAPGAARKWSFAEDFLDTEIIRGIGYGNLVLRRQSHLFLAHGVIAAVALLAGFWLISVNWEKLTAWTGLFGGEEDERVVNYTMVTSVTQLPPPPPIAKPEAPKPAQKVAPAAVEAPSNVGKIKKVKKEEAPPEQTLATQEEIKQAIQQQGVEGGGVPGGIGAGPVFVPCEIMPAFVKQKKPRYPDMARRAGIEGRVIVSVLISENGRPIKAQIVKRIPSDQTVFDDSAVECVMSSSYSPGIQNGSPIKVWLTVPIRFELQ